MNYALEALGVVSPSAAAIARHTPGDPALAKLLLPGAAAGLVGLSLWPQHRVLGFLGAEALGLNAYRYIRNEGDDRTRAACNVGAAAAAIAGSLLWQKHPFYGWALGFLAGAVATSFVPGSNAHAFVEKVRHGV